MDAVLTTDEAMRFAFWGRVSTEDHQDSASSRAWQLTRGRSLIEPHGGQVVAEFFDVDRSRSIPPQRRPQGQALLAALADESRGFEAVVVGEPQRAFYGNQFGNTFPLFVHYGVPLWVPEVGGPIDPHNEAHDLIMSVFGGVSKGERNRVRIRVRTAMAAQAQHEGRFLGGRPPYGYQLADAGPHPNPSKAADGQRLHALAIDKSAAVIVRRIFAEHLAGYSLGAIANRLNTDDVPCPSAHNPQRNPHRSGAGWMKSSVRTILQNPRYTGRQVWNRQRKDEVLIDVNDVALGHTTRMRWNDPGKWIYSDAVAHPPLIDDEDFGAAQELLASPRGGSATRKPRQTRHPYLLQGLVYCEICARRMHGTWSNDRAYYRCRPNDRTLTPGASAHPRSVCLPETAAVALVDDWLATQRRSDLLGEVLAGATDHQAADPSDLGYKERAEFYAKIAVRITFDPGRKATRIEVPQTSTTSEGRVGGDDGRQVVPVDSPNRSNIP